MDVSNQHIVSNDAVAYVENLKEVQEEVRKRLENVSQHYEAMVDQHKRYKEYQVGDWVMVFLRKERVKRLGHAKFYTSLVKMPMRLNFLKTLIYHHFLMWQICILSMAICKCKNPPQVTSSKGGRIQAVIHVWKVKTRAGNNFRFLVRWAGKPDYENSWISEEDFMKIDPEMCQAAKLTTRLEASSF